MQQASITESRLRTELTRRLSTQKILIILDDVCEPMLIEQLLFPVQWLKYLITTQIPQLWRDATCKEIPLNGPTSEEACQILTNHVYGTRILDITPPLQDAIDAIVEKAGKHPLVLANMATNILASIQGNKIHELEEWRNVIKYFEVLIQDEGASSSAVLFNSPYPRSMKASMTMALRSLSKDAQNLLLVASIFESQPVPVPEVVFKLVFKRLNGTLANFSRCSNHLQNNNFIQIDSEEDPWSTIPYRTWSLHAMRQIFVGMIKGSEVKSMVDVFLKQKTENDNILIELLLLHGHDEWHDQAAKCALGVPMYLIQTDSSQSRSLQLAPIKSFVPLLHADTREEWEEKSHQLATQILQKYIYCHELDDNSISILLRTEETYLYTLVALEKFSTRNPPRVYIPKTTLALVNLLEPTNNRPAHVPSKAAMLLGRIFYEMSNIKVQEFASIPHAMERLVALLVEDASKDAQSLAACAMLGNLAADAECRVKIQIPNVIGRLVALLSDNASKDLLKCASIAIGNLAMHDEYRVKIIQFPNVIERLVALLSDNTHKDVQKCASFALGNLAMDAENRVVKIAQFPNAIERLAALLAEDVPKDVQMWAAIALGRLAQDVENRVTITQFPNVIGRLATLLAEGVPKEIQKWAAIALAELAQDVENRMEIVQIFERLVTLLTENHGEDEFWEAFICKISATFLAEDSPKDVQEWAAVNLGNLAAKNKIKMAKLPNIIGRSLIGRLVALLAENVREDVQWKAAFALGSLATDAANRIKIAQFPHVIGRLVALLSDNASNDLQKRAAVALGNLAEYSELRIKIAQFPNVIGRLVAFLAKDVREDVRQRAAFALGKLVHSENYEGTLQAYEEGQALVAIDPNQRNMLRRRCFVKAKRGDFDGALTDINKYIELGGDRGYGVQERGIVKRMKGDLHGALTDLNERLSPEPDNYECLKHRGLVRFLLSDENGARADAECALRVKPDSVDRDEYGLGLVLGTMSVEFLGYNLK